MIRRYGIYLAWVVACISTLGSLYFSEIGKLELCHLCWYQRIAIFPMVILLGMAAYKNAKEIIPYALVILCIGLIVSIYMVLIQEIPGWQPIQLCHQGPSCTKKEVIAWGWLTLPILSLVAFVLMIGFLMVAWKKKE